MSISDHSCTGWKGGGWLQPPLISEILKSFGQNAHQQCLVENIPNDFEAGRLFSVTFALPKGL